MELSEELKACQAKWKVVTGKEMANKTVLKSLVLELRPRLCSGNVFLQTNRQLTRVDSASDSRCVILSLAGDGWSGVVAVNCPHRLSSKPSGFQIDDSSVTFGVVFEPMDKRVGSSSAEVLKVAQSEKATLKSIDGFTVPCKSCQPKCLECGSCVWKDQLWDFKRVLELPSTPLEEVIGEWFCHGHGSSHSLVLQPSDCYYDCLSAWIYREGAAAGIVTCSTCKAWLGSVNKHSMCQFWGCTVTWELEDGSPWLNCLQSSPFEAFLEAVRRSALEVSAMKPIVKVLIESQLSDDCTSWVFLCILNGDLRVLLPIAEQERAESCDNVSEVGGDSLGKLEMGWSAHFTGVQPEKDVNEILADWKSHPGDLPLKTLLCPKSMKRVLFKEENELSCTRQWANNADVVTLKVAAPMYLAGVFHLKQSNQILPEKHRFCEGFSISYLEL